MTLIPKLPPELEWEIFELAAEAGTEDCAKYMLVSRQVYHWVKPALYAHLIVVEGLGHSPKLDGHIIPLIEPNHRFVKHLCVTNFTRLDLIIPFIQKCINLLSLAFWNSDLLEISNLRFLAHFRHLRRLSVHMNTLVDASLEATEDSWFPVLTELEIYTGPTNISRFNQLPIFPSLLILNFRMIDVCPLILSVFDAVHEVYPHLRVGCVFSMYARSGAIRVVNAHHSHVAAYKDKIMSPVCCWRDMLLWHETNRIVDERIAAESEGSGTE
ncbi:hypothetical protein BDZ89DRAFT_1069703 [Hymenopellis radicata]|nr:hypothetical protein BDZ89DRAFT_1069703 [Hymenopellis radicata]